VSSKRRKTGKLTRKLLIHPSILRKQSVKLSVRGNHAALCQIGIQTQAAHRAEQTSDGDFLLSIGLRADSEHAPAILAIRFLLVVCVDVHIRPETNDDVFTACNGWQTAAGVLFGGGSCEQQRSCICESQPLRLEAVVDRDGKRAVVLWHVD
jgi:hypothetical protein